MPEITAAPPPEQLLFTTDQVAALYGMTRRQVQRLVQKGTFGDPRKLPRNGVFALIPREAVLAYAQVGGGEK